MKQKCPKCKQVYEFELSQKGQMFSCLECGEDFLISDEADCVYEMSATENKSSKKPLIVTMVVIIAILALVCLFVLLSGGTNTGAVSAKTTEKVKKDLLQSITSGEVERTAKLLRLPELKKDGWEFLTAAVNSGNEEMVRTVLSSGISINVTNANGENVLLAAAKNKNYAMFKFLLEKGAKLINEKGANSTSDASTVWSVAAENGAVEIIEYLVMSQDHVTETASGDKAIFRALRKGHNECVKALLDKYIIDEVDSAGNTLLHAALQMDNSEIIELLLRRGANLSQVNNAGENSFFVAVKTGKSHLIKFFDLKKVDWDVTANDGTSIPMICVAVGNNRLLKQAITAANVNLTDLKGRTALYYACEKNDLDAITTLLTANANCNAGTFLNSPVYISVTKGHAAAVKLLRNKGGKFDPSDTDEEGNNLVMLAAASGSRETLLALPLENFDLFATNRAGKNAHAIAEEKGNSLAPVIFNLMDEAMYRKAVAKVNAITDGSDFRRQIPELEKFRKEMEQYPKTADYIARIKGDVERKLRNRSTQNVTNAINAARASRYYETAIKMLENAIADNPEATNLDDAKRYLKELKERLEREKEQQAELERKRKAIRMMNTLALKSEITTFINKWLTDMQMGRATAHYWFLSSLATTLYNVRSWDILGPSDGEWSHFNETVIVSVESTNKGGSPIRVNWKVKLLRSDNDMKWKIVSVDE